jgi:hypothetical protein
VCTSLGNPFISQMATMVDTMLQVRNGEMELCTAALLFGNSFFVQYIECSACQILEPVSRSQ